MALEFLKKSGPPGKITAAEIRKKYEESNSALQREQWTFVLNRAMLHNEQWLNYDRVRNSVTAIPRDPDRLRATMNRLWPATRHLMSKLLSRPLVFEVAPNEADDASVRGAHIAEAVLEDIHRVHNWESLREQISWATWIGGTAVLSLDWDGTKGTKIGYREDESSIHTGEMCESALTILEVAWEPGALDAEKAYWWIRAQALPPSTVQEMYGMKDIPAADAGPAQGYMGRAFAGETFGRPRTDLTLVLTYYERPCDKRPNGAVCTVVNDKIVDGPTPWPFPFKDRLNMTVFRETKILGRAHGDTVFSAAVPVQVAYNQSWSNILEHLKLTGNARMLVPDAALDGIEELTDLPGELINYNNSAGKPEWMQPANMPPWVIENTNMLSQQMDDILGWHEISRGVAPSNIESGVGLSVVVEQDSTPLGALTREMANGFERFACMVLETYASKVKNTRKARIQQKNQTPEIVEWDGTSLAGQTVATVPMDAVMPRSRTALMAFAKELWDRKIISDPQMFTRIADLPDQDNLIDGIDSNAAKAQRENRDMAVGRIRVPRDFDDHAGHIKKHNDFRRTLRYETMPQEWQDLVDLHIEAHETMAAEEAGQQTAKLGVSPAFAGAPTAAEAAPLPEGMQPIPGALPGEEMQPGVPSGTEGTPPPSPDQALAPTPEAPTPS